VRGLVVTDTNAFNSAPFTTLVSTVQTKPGTEVKLVGTVGGTPFEVRTISASSGFRPSSTGRG